MKDAVRAQDRRLQQACRTNGRHEAQYIKSEQHAACVPKNWPITDFLDEAAITSV